MPGFSTEQAKAVFHVALTLLRGQLAVLALFSSQVQTGFQILRGLAFGCSLGIPSSFRVTLRVNLFFFFFFLYIILLTCGLSL